MKVLTTIFLLIATLSSSAQFYYRDIVVNRQTNEKRNLYKDQKVKSARLTSTEGNGEPTPGFNCSQSVSADFSRIQTSTASGGSVPTSLTAFYNDKGLLYKAV